MPCSLSKIIEAVVIWLITEPQICQNLFLVTMEIVAVYC